MLLLFVPHRNGKEDYKQNKGKGGSRIEYSTGYQYLHKKKRKKIDECLMLIEEVIINEGNSSSSSGSNNNEVG